MNSVMGYGFQGQGQLTLSFPVEMGTLQTAIATKPLPAGRITVAGFGLTNTGQGNTAGDLLVGWQTWDARQDGLSLAWAAVLTDGQLVPCEGDSGAPVFAGEYNGAFSESRPFVKTLNALVSTNNENRSSAHDDVRRCKESTRGTAARVDVQVTWLCRVSAGQINGCPAQPDKVADFPMSSQARELAMLRKVADVTR